MTNPTIFKAYDVRGIYQQDLDEQTAYALGIAYVKLRQGELNREQITVIAGRDMRLSSPSMHKALISGFTNAGAKVVDIGLTSTPTFYFAVASLKTDGGIIVSASHNPGEYNGFKITRERAIPISGETGMATLRDMTMELINKNIEIKEAQNDLVEQHYTIMDENIEFDLNFSQAHNIRPLKIVADTANSMGAQYLNVLFANLPCELIKMNWELDGNFPAHEADPLKDENNKDLQERVIAEKADLGIATDGDGDRIFFIDNEGKTINPAIIRGLLARIFLRNWPNSKICYDIRPGKITRDMIEEAGGIPVLTRVGHSLIKEQAIKENSHFAGEGSGHFFLNLDELGCFEMPNIMILKLLEEFSKSTEPIADQLRPLNKYFHSGEINSIADKAIVFEKLKEKYADAEINPLDGLTFEYPDFWFNVRGSNTEPKLRLNLEARTQELMEEKRDEVLKIIRS